MFNVARLSARLRRATVAMPFGKADCALLRWRNPPVEVGNLGNPGNRRNPLGKIFEEAADIALTIVRDAAAPPPFPHRLPADAQRPGDRAHANSIDGVSARCQGEAAVLHTVHGIASTARRYARPSRTMAKAFRTCFASADLMLRDGSN